ncbi:unnamed protein product [Pleuronectes platessa]|uniref:Uncharacterized protein n=1 Tax=Pleuronectes platessa TaxID=8262 RepID=A0A9N7VAK8_PLEPL|nr:unnamed protein product [Pleuronectes platessa]
MPPSFLLSFTPNHPGYHALISRSSVAERIIHHESIVNVGFVPVLSIIAPQPLITGTGTLIREELFYSPPLIQRTEDRGKWTVNPPGSLTHPDQTQTGQVKPIGRTDAHQHHQQRTDLQTWN